MEKKLENKQDRYFECLEVCDDNEQESTCREVCTPALTDDPEDQPKVDLPIKEEDEYEYVHNINIFEEGDQNSQEWTDMFISMREKFGALKPDPITGLGVTYGGEVTHD
jgi:hypothetical protein